MSNYWPWWAGAVGLAIVTINHTVATDRPFGVSGAWDRVLHWRAERRAERADSEFTSQLTVEQRGQIERMRPAPVVSQLALLLSILLGGWIASMTAGRFEIRLDMGDAFRQMVTGNPITMVGALFFGGVLVGFGTRLAGGCSSGHGLNGCGRLQPVSILATAVFFGTAVGVSFLLWKVF